MYISADQFIPGEKSNAEEWIAWYKIIPGGRDVRNAVWLKAWSLRGAKTNIANTAALRSYMRDEAGIELTTNGVGKILDVAVGIGDRLESITLVSGYALLIGAGFCLTVAGALAYQGIKNPEYTGKVLGVAAKTMMEKGGSMMSKPRNLYLMGSAGVLLVGVIVYFYVRMQNQTTINNIILALDKPTDPLLADSISSTSGHGDSRDLGISKIFAPTFWRTAPGKVTIWAKNANGTDGPAMKYAKIIHAAGDIFSVSPTRGADVVSVFKSLKTKEDVSKLADVFAGMYKTDLYNYLNEPYMTGYCNPDQDTCFLGAKVNYLKQTYDWIKNQLT